MLNRISPSAAGTILGLLSVALAFVFFMWVFS